MTSTIDDDPMGSTSAHTAFAVDAATKGSSPPGSETASAQASSSSTSVTSPSGSVSPTPRRRGLTPGSLPHFPSATEPRTPIPPILSPSPTSSPVPADRSSPFPSSTTPLKRQRPPAGLSLSDAQSPGFAPHSPWAMLAATSGAPTPSLNGPAMGPRSTSNLGYPFEQLNLGNSWSANNLSEQAVPPVKSPAPQTPTRSATIPSGPICGPSSLDAFSNRIAGGALPSARSPLAFSSSLAERRASLPQLGGPSFQLQFKASNSSVPAPSVSKVQPLASQAVPKLIAKSSTLVLDLRPPSSYQASHLPTAHSLSIPSTLLRRPAFSLSKIGQMLTTPASRECFCEWRGMSDIIFVDSDSTVVPDGSVLQGLAAKFDREGYTGHLWFVRGGHAAIVSDGEITLVSEDEAALADDGSRPHSVGFNHSGDVLDVAKLSKLAFQRGSTTGSARPSRGTHGTYPATAGSTARGDPFNLLAPPSEASHSQRGSTPRSADSGRVRLQPANPFFDNIRQNLELAHGGITERIPLALPEDVQKRANELPKFLRDLVQLSDSESSELLARQFYEIERSEQQRLQSVMDILSQDCTTVTQPAGDSPTNDPTVVCNDPSQPYFPFSISAGVERGTKNRYKNIWPYDFSRVRLGTPGDDDSDYINASFVQPPGTTRRYIATQGPLDTTYRDFWTLVWEQHVHVIVMLTKQYEAGLLKCGKYWGTQKYGDLNLQVLSETGGEENAQLPTGFNFEVPRHGAANPTNPTSEVLPNIKRTFKLWHDGQKDQAPRTITQIQCVEWPDWDVPDSPEVLLHLMRDVDKAVCEQSSFADATDRCTYPPVLVHCSAGVGRTGSYILVDAVADGLRREYRKTHDSLSTEGSAAPPKKSPPPAADGKAAQFLSPGILEGKPAMVLSPAGGAAPLSEAMEVDAKESDHQPQSFAKLAEALVEEPTDFKLHQPPAMDAALADLDAPLPVTSSHVPHQVTRPLGSMTEPIMDVLRAMRVQRMSLVQSLRQFIFAHRAVIAFYLCMLDEEAQRSSSSDSSNLAHRNTSTGATSIASSTDDEGHVKRKPSETELQASGDLHGSGLFPVDSLRLGEGASNLSKRLSFKKRRATSNGSTGDGAGVPAVPRVVSASRGAGFMAPPSRGPAGRGDE